MTHDIEYSVHKGQNSKDDNLCKNDVQLGIYLKLLINPLMPGGNKMATHTQTNLQIYLSMCDLFVTTRH